MAITRLGPNQDITAAKIAGQINFKNLWINGDMSLAQRDDSSTGITSTAYYTLDRVRTNISSLGTWTQSRSTDVPTGQGFAYSLKMDCTTADASPAASDYLNVEQRFEGRNLQYLKKGTSNAESLTLSFWVKSNKTGTYIAEIIDTDNDRNNVNAYTINSANTWEKKTITLSGDTTGTLTNDSNVSMRATFWLGAGSDYTSGTLQSGWATRNNANRLVGQVNLADNTANEWYITGVQLEADTSASDFEFLPYDVNYRRCLRYYEKIDYPSGGGDMIMGAAQSSQYLECYQPLLEIKRAQPTVQVPNPSDFRINDWRGHDEQCNGVLVSTPYTRSVIILFSKSTHNLTQGYGGYMNRQQGEPYITVDAEL